MPEELDYADNDRGVEPLEGNAQLFGRKSLNVHAVKVQFLGFGIFDGSHMVDLLFTCQHEVLFLWGPQTLSNRRISIQRSSLERPLARFSSTVRDEDFHWALGLWFIGWIGPLSGA